MTVETVNSKLQGISVALSDANQLDAVADFYDRCGYTGGIQPGDMTFIAKSTEEILGAARLAIENGVLVLRGMQVIKNLQRHGIGKNLLTALNKAIGTRECYCIPYAHLKEFYGCIGFFEIAPSIGPAHLQERLKQYLDSGLNVVLMSREGDPHNLP